MLKELVGGQFMNLGYRNELEYWKSKGGVGNTVVDCMVSYLSSQGYRGDAGDSLRSWLGATQIAGNPKDSVRKLAGYK